MHRICILLENDGEPGWQHAQHESDGGQQHHHADARHQQVILGAHDGVRPVIRPQSVHSTWLQSRF